MPRHERLCVSGKTLYFCFQKYGINTKHCVLTMNNILPICMLIDEILEAETNNNIRFFSKLFTKMVSKWFLHRAKSQYIFSTIIGNCFSTEGKVKTWPLTTTFLRLVILIWRKTAVIQQQKEKTYYCWYWVATWLSKPDTFGTQKTRYKRYIIRTKGVRKIKLVKGTFSIFY